MTTDKQYYLVSINILDVYGQIKPAALTVPAADDEHAREIARYTFSTNWPTAQGFNFVSVTPLSPEENRLRNTQLDLFSKEST